MGGSSARTVSRWAVVGGALFALAACGWLGSGGERTCTLLGAQPGLGVTVAPSDAASVESASLRVCWDGTCRDPALELGPGAMIVPEGCDRWDPEACPASAAPEGTKAGFATVKGLPKAPVRVTLTLRDSKGRTLVAQDLEVTPKATYPNGKNCPEDGAQADLTVAGGRVTVR